MNMRLLTDRVLIEPLEKVQEGKIIIPEMAKERPVSGKVIGVGPGKILDNGDILSMIVKEGDTVLYTHYSGVEVTLEKKKYLLMRESDIYGIIDEEVRSK